MNKPNCMVAQSGGPTVAINASLAGVLSGVTKSNIYHTCYGSINGVYGILHEHILDLSKELSNNSSFLDQLKITPAMYLGSCRYKLPDFTEDPTPYETIFSVFEQKNIGAFFYIGGNDSMDTVLKLGAYAKSIDSDIKIIGVPKTIDNDLCKIDHTPGYGSAAKFVATTMLEVAHDTYIYKVPSVTIVEVMGRDSGWLTGAAALARNEYNPSPDFIYLPEVAFDKEKFIIDVRNRLKERHNVIIAVSEGIKDTNGNYLSVTAAAADTFGHSQLSGTGKTLEYLVKDEIGVKVRSVELNVLQRAASHIASKTDLDEAFTLGELGVKGAEEGRSECMVSITRTSNHPYSVSYDYQNIGEIANYAKQVPREWINEEGNDIKDAFIEYMRPLIMGEANISYTDGLPSYLSVSHLISRPGLE